MDRAEHLQWAKDRANQYVEVNDLPQAWASMVSDMRKHDDLREHAALELGSRLLFAGKLNTQAAMRSFIDGFN